MTTATAKTSSPHQHFSSAQTGMTNEARRDLYKEDLADYHNRCHVVTLVDNINMLVENMIQDGFNGAGFGNAVLGMSMCKVQLSTWPIQWSPLIRSTFCPRKINQIGGLTL